jgi:hypothetical protein
MNDKFSLFTYLLVVAMRATTFRRRWDMPLLYGPNYFHKLRVGQGFYENTGRKLLQLYHAILLWPYFAEFAALLVIVFRHRYQALTSLCLIAIFTTVVNQRVSLALLMRSAKKFEEKEVDPAPAAVSFSLNPRRLADYSNPIFEIVLASVTTVTLIVLAQIGAPMGPPLLILYLQIGLLLIKKMGVDWRSAAPQENSEIYLEVRERRRKLLLFACDFYRGAAGFVMIKQAAMQLTHNEGVRWALQYLYLAGSIVCVCFAVVKTNELYAMYRKTKPTLSRKRRLAVPDPDGFVAGGFLYFDTDNPAIFVQGPRTVAINAGNHRLLLAATYLLGLLLLSVWASKAQPATMNNQGMDQQHTSALNQPESPARYPLERR